MTSKVTGLDALQATLKKMPKLAQTACARGQYAAAQVIMLDAKRRAPEESGDMAISGYASRPEQHGQAITVEMGFGGPSSEYVVRQHEDTSLHHPALSGRSTKTGEHHFFSNAIQANDAQAKAIIAAFVRSYLIDDILPPMPQQQVPTEPGPKGSK